MSKALPSDIPVTTTNTCVIPGRVEVTTHTDEHGERTVEERALCPHRCGVYACDGEAGHRGPHHALGGRLTWGGVSVADEARAFDPFDETYSEEERRGGERALEAFARMLDSRREG